jgi:hypothetical protein
VQVVPFVEDVLGSSASWSASIGTGELDGPSSVTTRNDMIEGAPVQVARASNTANTPVLDRRAST